jgi:hypothetical protein
MSKIVQTQKRVVTIVLAFAILGSFLLFFNSGLIGVAPGTAAATPALKVLYTDNTEKMFYPAGYIPSLNILFDDSMKNVKSLEPTVIVNVNFDDTKEVDSYTVTTGLMYMVYSGSTLLKEAPVIGEVGGAGSTLQDNKDLQVPLETLTKSRLEGFYDYLMGIQYTLKVDVGTVTIDVTFTDGSTQTFTAEVDDYVEWKFRRL